MITPYIAGHMVGGSVWRLSSGDEDIVYAVDFNHKRERHLEATVFEVLRKPFILITNSLNAAQVQTKRKERDEQLVEAIRGTMRDDGVLLLVTDTAGRLQWVSEDVLTEEFRSLEILQLLNMVWDRSEMGLSVYPLLLLGHSAFNVLEFSKTLIEYMSSDMMRAIETNRDNPFQLAHVKLVYTLEELSQYPGSKVIYHALDALAQHQRLSS